MREVKIVWNEDIGEDKQVRPREASEARLFKDEGAFCRDRNAELGARYVSRRDGVPRPFDGYCSRGGVLSMA